ncbi:uncharacterized protein LOC135204352 [Macrobrachium nipponense]|uniref:uncharacterized protein LOC135204352 n=1 Tax=Macrobrachium nipponense TaxID=159736 RepID=UPI0030C80DBA
MSCHAKEPRLAPKISTPNSLVFHAAVASALYIVSYCLPILHDYFMAREPDSFYKRFMAKRRRKLEIGFYRPRFLVSQTTKGLASHLTALKDFYWSGRVLCNKHYTQIRSLVSQEIITLLNSGLNYAHVLPLCKFVIQLLFCYDVGDFSTQFIEIRDSSECQELAELIKALAPFHLEFLDARSLIFGDFSPMEPILSGSPELKKIFIRDIVFQKGMELLPQLRGRALREIGIYREGSFPHRCDLYKFFFKGKPKDEVIKAAYGDESVQVSFPLLFRVYVRCSLDFECFHSLKYAMLKFHPDLRFASFHETTYLPHCELPCCREEARDHFGLTMMLNFPSLIGANPAFQVFSKKFINFKESCNINHLELSGTAIWLFGSRIDIYLARCFSHFDGLKLLVLREAMNLYGNHPTPGHSYSILFRDAGRALLMLTIQVSTTADLAEAVHCLNYCPILREFCLRLDEAWIIDVRALLRQTLRPLRQLTKIEFCGTLDRDSISIAPVCEKLIKTAPNLQYIMFSESMVNEIPLLSSDCFLNVVTLHIKGLNIGRKFAEALRGVLKLCPSVGELILEETGKKTKWAKKLDRSTALTVRCVPSCSFLEEIDPGD